MVSTDYLYKEKFRFHGSMAELADDSFTYDSEMPMEPFYDSPRVKAYLFKMKPMVVNLKRREPQRDNPMAYFEFVLEGNSGDVVVELKLRESEFVDLAERLIESQSYEALDTPEGKRELKESLRRELNKKLTDGILRKVEIQNVFIKP
jgi:flagellar basal body-associated protein FliL